VALKRVKLSEKQHGGAKGLKCPACGCRHFHTLHTYATSENQIRRRRSCRHCGHQLTTAETTLGAQPKQEE